MDLSILDQSYLILLPLGIVEKYHTRVSILLFFVIDQEILVKNLEMDLSLLIRNDNVEIH